MRSGRVEDRLHIGNIVRNGVVFNFRNWRGEDVSTNNLLETVARLFALLKERQIDYVLVGGIALLQYVEGRNTEDIDLIMALSSLDSLPEIQIADQNADFMRGKFDELKIDILLTRNPLFDKIRQQYTTIQPFIEQEIPTATVEGLLLLKMYALPSLYRQGNFARVALYENDLAMLIHDYQPELDPLLAELSQYVSDTDLDAVRDILAEIQQRIERFNKTSRES
ncbi:MAG: hypothetical protein V7641_3564 [Blastocatellia bacterium]